MQQAIADFLLLSIELQKAQKVATPHALKYKSVEINEETARSLSSIGRLINAGDYAKAQSMATELKDTDDSFAKLSKMLASHEYERAKDLASIMEKEHIGVIRKMDAVSTKTVLAVDDMPQILSIVNTALKNHYKVLGAPNGEIALDIMAQNNIDLFFVDIDMPVMDGFELTGRIRADVRYKETPILFLTGNSSRENIEKALRLGSNDFIIKPAYDVTLLAKARKYLD
jgi:PleD family two-component response regulator